MLNRSLRAVFRKESWMFWAGLLFSIADLLKFFDLRDTSLPLPQTVQDKLQINSMFLADLPHQEHGGLACLFAARFPKSAPPGR
jgi:hypothetical protein